MYCHNHMDRYIHSLRNIGKRDMDGCVDQLVLTEEFSEPVVINVGMYMSDLLQKIIQ